MRLLNTLTGIKETIEKPEGRPLSLFVCGPTVYDYAHIGHARTYIAFDLLVRYLRGEGWEVQYLQNITDVDDKIIERARARHMTPAELAEEFERAYLEDMGRIGVSSVSTFARASAHIDDIVRQVETLLAKGHAYEIPGNGYYFDIASFPEYGKLSKRTAAQAEDAVTRIDEHVGKRNKGDFALWKLVSVPDGHEEPFSLVDGEPAWRTKLGWGRPGWHIEDTAITEHFFGPQYDIHGGAEDLKFPHHEAEIAQQEAASGKKPFVRIWLHTGFMRVDGTKMGKSLGNFITIRTFLETHAPETLRFLVASHHYRSPVNYTPETAVAAAHSLDTLRDFLDRLSFVSRHEPATTEGNDDFTNLIDAAITSFHAALEDDFNTPEAIAALFTYINAIKPRIWTLSHSQAEKAKEPVRTALELFGIPYRNEIPENAVSTLAEERELCRTNKQFAQADDLRKKIGALGYSVDDTPIGPFVRKIPML